jgi:hypothetical protein
LILPLIGGTLVYTVPIHLVLWRTTYLFVLRKFRSHEDSLKKAKAKRAYKFEDGDKTSESDDESYVVGNKRVRVVSN